MERRMARIGSVAPKTSLEIKRSKIGLGFEKLDRDVFDPEKAYPFVAQTGVKWARLQSGWQRTEQEKGVYDFAWLDAIVDNMLAVGVEPWLCLCYGNALYSPEAAQYFGAVGCPPIYSQEAREGWKNYVTATVEHYKGRIHYYEVWNEPDGPWCWKKGANPIELGQFTKDTALHCKAADPSCEVIGFATCRTERFGFLEELCRTGVCAYLDGISYHCYKIHDQEFEDVFNFYDDLRRRYNPKLKIFQGESGTQSRHDGNGALRKASWTPTKQAKFLLRHLIIDIACGVEFTSYFSCMDMIEALNGREGDVASYLDFGYFGVVGADFDENGRATGEYSPKESFRALQTLCSILHDDYEFLPFPCEGEILHSMWMWGMEYDFNKARSYGLRKPNGSRALIYWNSDSNILTQTFDGTISLRITPSRLDELKLVDLLTGDIYAIPENMIVPDGQFTILKNLPIKDYPIMLMSGDFLV